MPDADTEQGDRRQDGDAQRVEIGDAPVGQAEGAGRADVARLSISTWRRAPCARCSRPSRGRLRATSRTRCFRRLATSPGSAGADGRLSHCNATANARRE